jgi:uncharacterized protein (DUF302 family)
MTLTSLLSAALRRGVTVEHVEEQRGDASGDLGFSVAVPDGYDEAVVRTRLALRAEGFSIITEMHVGGLLGPDAGDERQYLIMGAWAPTAALRRVGGDVEAGVHLPCNFVVQEMGRSALVAALDPAEEVDAADERVARVAVEAQGALARVLERVASSP